MKIAVFLTLAAAACAGEITGGKAGGPDGGADDSADAQPGEPTLRITRPAANAVFERGELDGGGALVARVQFEAAASGGIERVAYIGPGGVVLGEGSAPDFAAELTIPADGTWQIDALGYDAGDAELASATVRIQVVSDLADCHAALDLYGVEYTVGPSNQGVPDPVTVTLPIGGIGYRYVSNEAPRSTFFMDCSLARSLAQAAPILKAHDVVEVADIGVYNYRCIGGGTPPDCPNGVSQHAYAKAIDIAGVTTSDGTFYSVNDDWVIDPAGESTCTAATVAGKDAFLHELICDLKGDDVWAIVLTPNYNADHRNHFHVDLTEGSDFIRSGRGAGVDWGPDYH